MGRHTTGERSADEVAAILGCTQQNVTRIETNALRKFREAFTGDMDDYLPTVCTRSGRWNGRRVVRCGK